MTTEYFIPKNLISCCQKQQRIHALHMSSNFNEDNGQHRVNSQPHNYTQWRSHDRVLTQAKRKELCYCYREHTMISLKSHCDLLGRYSFMAEAYLSSTFLEPFVCHEHESCNHDVYAQTSLQTLFSGAALYCPPRKPPKALRLDLPRTSNSKTVWSFPLASEKSRVQPFILPIPNLHHFSNISFITLWRRCYGE